MTSDLIDLLCFSFVFAPISSVASFVKYSAHNHSKKILSKLQILFQLYQTKLDKSISHWSWFLPSYRNLQLFDIVWTTNIQELVTKILRESVLSLWYHCWIWFLKWLILCLQCSYKILWLFLFRLLPSNYCSHLINGTESNLLLQMRLPSTNSPKLGHFVKRWGQLWQIW